MAVNGLNSSVSSTAIAWLVATYMVLHPLAMKADSVPEVLHYQFDGKGTSVPNLASAPPLGTENATLVGGVTQAPPNLGLGLGGAMIGTGVTSTADFLNTNWAPNLGTESWTISFVSQDIAPSSTLFYVFGDVNTASFRCFTNGVAGATNWILRGAGLTDISILGGATVVPRRNTFVYDATLNTVRAYLDGALVSTIAQPMQPLPNVTGSGPFKVGGYSANVGLPAGGKLDDFRVYRRALTGDEVADIGRRAIVAVQGNGVSIADNDTTPDAADHTDFGGVLINSGNVVRTFTIFNNGNKTLSLSAFSVAGAHAADFTITTQALATVLAGESTTLQVTFDPSSDGLRSASLNFTTNDNSALSFNFDIQGSGFTELVFRDGFE